MNRKGNRKNAECLRDSEEGRIVMTEQTRRGFRDKVAVDMDLGRMELPGLWPMSVEH